jgi:hypothetical protein
MYWGTEEKLTMWANERGEGQLIARSAAFK